MGIELKITIELQGEQQLVGRISGNSCEDACFKYSNEYLNIPDIRPISLSLPLQKKTFTPQETRNFFEGLLPEGFSRKSVANWLKTDEADYLTILKGLGGECLGAIQVQNNDLDINELSYELLSNDQVRALAAEGATKSTELLMETHLSLTGASGKVGLYFDRNNEQWYLPKGRAASTHIVKQSHVRLQKIVLNEQLCMLTAKKIGIEVPDSFVINLGQGEENEILYATERYDRILDSHKLVGSLQCPLRLHQEDFSQALGIPSSQKYEKTKSFYMEKMFHILNDYSKNPIEDKLKLWNMIVFNYFIGNTDCHIKNFSLLYSPDLKSIRLAPAYDIVCTSIYGLTDEMSFYIGDELNMSKMSRETFRKAAKTVGIGEKIAMKNYDYIADNIITCIERAANELSQIGFQEINVLKDQIIQSVKKRSN